MTSRSSAATIEKGSLVWNTWSDARDDYDDVTAAIQAAWNLANPPVGYIQLGVLIAERHKPDPGPFLILPQAAIDALPDQAARDRYYQTLKAHREAQKDYEKANNQLNADFVKAAGILREFFHKDCILARRMQTLSNVHVHDPGAYVTSVQEEYHKYEPKRVADLAAIRVKID
jgi:hypothetical protein